MLYFICWMGYINIQDALLQDMTHRNLSLIHISFEMQRVFDEMRQWRQNQEDHLHTRQDRSENREAYIDRDADQMESRFYIPS